MANRNWSSGGKLYSMHTSPVLIDCNFEVDSTSPTGIVSLKGPAVAAVYMNCSTTPSASNPNPPAGYIVVQLQDGYNQSLVNLSGRILQLPASSSTTVTAGDAVIITNLGTATEAQSLADFRAVGLPLGITPAIGVAFVATSSATIGHSATADTVTTTSKIACIDTIGDPNTTIAPDPTQNQGFGAQMILQCNDYGGVTAAPTDGTIINITMLLSNSSVRVQGE